MKKAIAEVQKRVVIAAPKFETAVVTIKGTAPLVQHKFSEKAKNKIRETQEAGSVARKGGRRDAKDFKANYEAACHVVSKGGWDGINASAFRCAMISACKVVGFKMTLAKLSLFVEADGYSSDGIPLVRIHGSKHMDVRPVRNATGVVDLRARPMWNEWSAKVRIRWDADQFSAADIVNLMSRVGQQVGIGEGRADSRESAGVGWGFFKVAL